MATWHWEEVDFIPENVPNADKLLFPGHIFMKSDVVEKMRSKGEFIKKRISTREIRSKHKKRKYRHRIGSKKNDEENKMGGIK